MDIEKIKSSILTIYQKWKNLSHSMDDDTYAELYESDVRSLIIEYCESQRYEVEGYPFQKRILGETDQNFDEDYFCYERDLKYLDILARSKEDVLELMYFYSKTFWPEQVDSKEEYRKYILDGNKNNPHDIEFKKKKKMMQKIEYLLNQVNGLIKSYEKLAKSTGENFNIFTVMGMETNEVKTHSAIIGELLNPEGSHGLNDIPLKLFIEQVKLEISDNQSALEEYTSVKTINNEELNEIFNLNTKFSKSELEVSFGKLNTNFTEGGRVDILICDKFKAFVIENKVYAGEGMNQLQRYNKAYSDAPILYLTLFGEKPNSAAQLIENKDYFIVSYKVSILNWLNECVKEAVKLPMLREVIYQYIILINKLTYQTMNEDLKKEVSNLIKDNFIEAAEINTNYVIVKNEVITDFWKELQLSLKGEWSVKIDDNILIPRFHHILFFKEENENAYFYCRYNRNNGEINYGIILNKKFNEFTGTKVLAEVSKQLASFNNFNSGHQSVIVKKDSYLNFNDPILLSKIHKNKNETLEDFKINIFNFINNNNTLYESTIKFLDQRIHQN